MGWNRDDDDMLDNEKWIRAIRDGGDSALMVWFRLRAWSSRRLSDGFVPNDLVDGIGQLKVRGRAKAYRALVAEGLLIEHEGSVEVSGYLERNPSRAQVLADRERRRDKQQAYRDRKRPDHGDEKRPDQIASDPLAERQRSAGRRSDDRERIASDPLEDDQRIGNDAGPEIQVEDFRADERARDSRVTGNAPVTAPALKPARYGVPARPGPFRSDPGGERVLREARSSIALEESSAGTIPAEFFQYPPGWRWSDETEAAAFAAGVRVEDLREHVDFWTDRRWKTAVTNLDGDLRRQLPTIRKRCERARYVESEELKRRSSSGPVRAPRRHGSAQPDAGRTGWEPSAMPTVEFKGGTS